jgi:transcriptional regulator with XRE-family HTH domain
MNTGSQIKKLRESVDITQRVLALKIGVSQSHLCNCERGRSVPSEQMVAKVQRVCGSGGKGLGKAPKAKRKTTRKAARRAASSKRKAKRR